MAFRSKHTKTLTSAMVKEEYTLIDGPHELFDGSFILEFLQPKEDEDSSVLMRSTYKAGHPLTDLGKKHPQRPPLHIHFSQYEAYQVLRGRVGTTTSYACIDRIATPQEGLIEIPPWTPHDFWPDSTCTEDTVLLVWAYPKVTPEPLKAMDDVFFTALLRHISDAYEGKGKMSMMQLCVTQHETGSALIMFPTAWWLGPLRWWIPWKFQAAVASLGIMMGYKPAPEEYLKNR